MQEVEAPAVVRRRTYEKIPDSKRQSLIRLVFDQGHAIKEAAEIMEVNYSSARTIISNFEKFSVINQLSKGGRERSVMTPSVLDEIECLISSNPSLTLREMKTTIEENHHENFSISMSTINRGLQELKITMKMAHRELDRVNSPEKIIARKNYALWFNNTFMGDFSRLVFIDESSFNLHLRRSHARSRQGTRAVIRIPTVRGRSISLLASMKNNRMCYVKTISNSTVNGDIFSVYVQELSAYLRNELGMDNACLILDNARIHRANELRTITNEYNYEFKFLSPYSYMLNPIENAFSKIKNGVRSRLRIGESGNLSDLMLSESRNITSSDCEGFFRYMSRNITNCAAEIPYTHQ